MKVTSEVYIRESGMATVHLWDGVRGRSFEVNVTQAVKLYPDRSVESAVRKVAKDRFNECLAFNGYD